MTSESVLDGNALAALLGDVFSFEPTTSISTCSGCGSRVPMAAWVVFVSAPGIVARCSSCEAVQIRIVHGPHGRTWVDLSGVARLEIVGAD